MKIFTLVNDKSKESTEFIGFHIDKETDEALTLIAINGNISKSSLLRQLATTFVDEAHRRVGSILDVAQQASLVWRLNKQRFTNIGDFKDKAAGELRKKGIHPKTIYRIFVEFNQLVKQSP